MRSVPAPVRSRGPASPGGPARRLVLLLLAAAVAALVGPASSAQAHAFLAASNPADGQVLAAAPKQLRLGFNELVVLSSTRIDVVDGTGKHFAPTAVRVVRQRAVGAGTEPVAVLADLPALGRGSYRVTWSTLSSDDIHAASGMLVFGVGAPVLASGLVEPAPPPAEAGLRWLILLGVSAAFGGALAARLLIRAGGPAAGAAARLATGLSAGGAIMAAGVAAALLVLQLVGGGAGASQLLWGSYGVRWGLREAGLLMLLGSASARLRGLRPGTGRALLAAGAVLASAGTAMLGHAGAGTVLNLTRVIAAAAPQAAPPAGAGTQGVLVLVVVLLPRFRRARPDRGLERTVLRLFGPPAAALVAILVVTGVYLSSEFVGSVDAALGTRYGRTLLVKVVLVGAAGALALVNTRRLHGRRPVPAPVRTVLAEAAAAVGVLALAALLTSGQPAMEPQLVQRATSASPGLVDRRVADLQETVAISPNRPGANVVSIDVFDTRRPAPAPLGAVAVSLTAPGGRTGPRLVAEPLRNGRWSVNATLPAGKVVVRVTVLRPGLPDTTASFPWTVGGPPDQSRPAVISTAPIGPGLKIAALGLLIAMVAGWALTAWVGRRGRRPTQADPLPLITVPAGRADALRG
jgi:copper transport protein